MAVPGRAGPAVGGGDARVGPLAGRRLEDVAEEVLGQVEARHAFRHRHLDELALPGALAVEQGGQDRLTHEQAGHPVGEQRRQRARLGRAVGARQQVGKAAGGLAA